jgi:regulator of protease activity HflC (stomatin/prohibitin superfamily)
MIAVAVLAIVALFVFAYVASAVKIVRPFQRGIVEQLGKYKTTVDPGLRIVAPLFQKIRIVDMREQVVDVPPQEVITKDNVVVAVDAVLYYEPTDPQRLIYNVASFILAVTKLAQTNLRNLVGDMQLDEALTSRDKINLELRLILDEATDKWGVRVGRVEIQRIEPPPDVQHAMHEQMKAERTRRAVVTSADGERQAAIARAEGMKSAAVLEAEGKKLRQVLEAEGQAGAVKALADAERYRQETVAQAQSMAIKTVYGAIHEGRPTPDLLAIKYLEALQGIADGQATKIFLPAEMSAVMGSIGAIGEMLRTTATGAQEAEPAAGPAGATGANGPDTRRLPGAPPGSSAS